MMHKYEFFLDLSYFHALVQTKFSASIKILGSYLSGKYFLKEFAGLSDTHGTICQSSYFDTPVKNDRLERKHHHLLDTVRSILLSSSIPSMFYGEVVFIAAYLLNWIPTLFSQVVDSMVRSLLSHSCPYKRLYG